MLDNYTIRKCGNQNLKCVSGDKYWELKENETNMAVLTTEIAPPTSEKNKLTF